MTEQGDLITVHKIEKKEIQKNSRKSWKFRKIKSGIGVHEILTRGQWAE
jgi:hypothetical protein